MDDELAWLDALAQADLVRRRQVRPIDLVEAAIRRIERIDPQINAVTTKLFDQARPARFRMDPFAESRSS